MNEIKELSFNERAKLFKREIQNLQNKYGLSLCCGYINSCDDGENLIIQEVKDDEVFNEVYFETLEKYL